LFPMPFSTEDWNHAQQSTGRDGLCPISEMGAAP
jgi:hypothetical protein